MDLDTFVNEESYNDEYTAVDLTADYDQLEGRLDTMDILKLLRTRFEDHIDYTGIDNTAWPVTVYKKQGRMIAWWDLENMQGRRLTEI